MYRRRRILLSEIDRQCSFALMAYQDAAAALARSETERVWYALQGLLTAASHLNQLLWPSPDGSVSWAVELRHALGVENHSPLAQPELAVISNMAAVRGPWSPDPADGARYLNSEASIFSVYGSVFELPGLLSAIAELRPLAQLELEHLRQVV